MEELIQKGGGGYFGQILLGYLYMIHVKNGLELNRLAERVTTRLDYNILAKEVFLENLLD